MRTFDFCGASTHESLIASLAARGCLRQSPINEKIDDLCKHSNYRLIRLANRAGVLWVLSSVSIYSGLSRDIH